MGCFFVALSLLITNIFFIILSVFGMEYYGKDSGGPIFMISVLGVNFIAAMYILLYEIRHRQSAYGKFWPYFIPFILVLFYVIEYMLGLVTSGTRAESTVLDVIVVTSLGVWGGTFCYRYGKIFEVIRNLELLMLFCTIALIMALPTMFVTRLGTAIGGAGDHQIVSYISAMAFGFTLCRIRFKPLYGYWLFKTRFYYVSSYFLLLIQALICIAGGGRGGFVMLLFIVVVIFFYSIKNIGIVFCYFIVLAASFFTIYTMLREFMQESGAMRAISIFTGEGEDGDNLRTELYKKSIDYFQTSPIWGHGVFSQYNWCQRVLDQPYCHNFFIELLLQGGLFLFLLGMIIVTRFASYSHHIIKGNKDYSSIIPLYSYAFVMLLFSGTYMTSPLFWFIVCFVLGFYKSNRIIHEIKC